MIEGTPNVTLTSTRSMNSPSMMAASRASSSTNLNLRAFGFENQSYFDATRELTRIRDKNFRLRPPSKDDDIWKRPPPDFRPQCFEPKPPPRNSQWAMKPWRYNKEEEGEEEESVPQSSNKQRELTLPELLKPKVAAEKDFSLRFHVMDSDEARADFVTNGMNPAGAFKNPGHHDYRSYPSLKSMGLPEFETSYDPDPFNIRFKSERLRIIHGLSRGIPPERNIKGPQMNQPLKQPPKWEARLHIPQGPWPTPAGQYSRFRPFWRSPQTVLLDRMEQALSTRWHDEKLASIGKNQKKITKEKSSVPVTCLE